MPGINQSQCDKYRAELYKEIQSSDDELSVSIKSVAEELSTLKLKVAEMQGEKKHARYITPILVAVLLAAGGFVITSVIQNSVRDAVKQEIKSLKEHGKDSTSLLTKYP